MTRVRIHFDDDDGDDGDDDDDDEQCNNHQQMIGLFKCYYKYCYGYSMVRTSDRTARPDAEATTHKAKWS